MKPRPKRHDPDNPPVPDDFPAKALTIDQVPAGLAAAIRRGRGKQKAATKVAISIRLDHQTIARYRHTGRGWQARMSATLDRAAKRLGG